MAENFDPYRDALVVETMTVWPDELAGTPAEERKKIEERLHAEPRQAAQLEYVRLHAGFCRRITVTAEDLARLR
jgi:hypothetical protein